MDQNYENEISNLSIYNAWNIKNKKNKFKVSAPTRNYKFELPDGLYSDFQGYFEYLIKNHETFAGNAPIKYVLTILKINLHFKIKTGYYLELITLKQ